MLHLSFRWLTLCLLLTTLAGCSLFTARPSLAPEGSTSAHELNSWQLNGKIGARVDGKSHSAYLNWHQTPTGYEIRLSGPLGRSAIQIKQSDGLVTLYRADQPPFTSPSLNNLLQETLGWDLPVDHLHWWVRGLPEPNTPNNVIHNENGSLKELQQSGWLVQYSRYGTHQQYYLPEKIRLQRDGLTLTILIKQWLDNSR